MSDKVERKTPIVIYGEIMEACKGQSFKDVTAAMNFAHQELETAQAEEAQAAAMAKAKAAEDAAKNNDPAPLTGSGAIEAAPVSTEAA